MDQEDVLHLKDTMVSTLLGSIQYRISWCRHHRRSSIRFMEVNGGWDAMIGVGECSSKERGISGSKSTSPSVGNRPSGSFEWFFSWRGTTPEITKIWTHICSCHNFSPLSSVQILLIPACCLLCVGLPQIRKCHFFRKGAYIDFFIYHFKAHTISNKLISKIFAQKKGEKSYDSYKYVFKFRWFQVSSTLKLVSRTFPEPAIL